ncbi:MAG TPA: D-glycerate dehydrogenase [Fontimonas sp.]
MNARVFVSRRLPGPALEQLAQQVDMQCWPEREPPSPVQLRDALRGCDGLLCTLTETIDDALLAAAPQLRVVSSCSVGVDHVDVAALTRRCIPLGHTPHVLTDATADLAFALLLATARRLPEGERFMRDGGWTPARRWEPDFLLGRDLRGATLGLIGLGAIGQAVARRAAGFGMRIVGWTPSGRRVDGVESLSFAEVLQRADFLSLHLALTAQTRHIVNAAALARMRSEAVLINTARGGLVDETALIHALRSGRIAAAGLDVFEREPIGADHPLLALPNVVVAPHIGSATLGTRSRMAQLAVDNLLAGLRGERMPHCVNPEVQP